MYHGRSSLRWLVYLGTMGLAALAPGRDQLPVWLAVAAACAPIVLFELGAGLAMEASSWRWRHTGLRLQLAGGAVYVVLLAAAASAHPPGLHGFPYLLVLTAL